jgi:hypothetical protein
MPDGRVAKVYRAMCECGNKIEIKFEKNVLEERAKYLVKYRLARTPFGYPPTCPTCNKAMKEEWEFEGENEMKEV